MDGVRGSPPVLIVIDATRRHRRARNLFPHEHVNHVDPVREQVGHLAAAEIEVGAEIVVLLRIVVAPLDRAQVSRPVQIRRLRLQRFRRAPQMIGVAVPPRPRQRDLAQLAGIHVFALRLQVVLTGALLHAHLANAVVFPRRFHDGRPFFNLQRERLFDVDVFARPQRIDRDTRMPMVRSGDENRVHLLHLQQLPVLRKILRLGGCLASFVDLLAVNVAYGNHIHGGNHLELGHVVPTALAAADHAQLDPVVGPEHAGVGGRGQGSRPANEVPSL